MSAPVDVIITMRLREFEGLLITLKKLDRLSEKIPLTDLDSARAQLRKRINLIAASNEAHLEMLLVMATMKGLPTEGGYLC